MRKKENLEAATYNELCLNTDEMSIECAAPPKKKKLTKSVVIICVFAIVAAFIVMLFVLPPLIPNSTSDKDFIDIAASFVTLNYSDYQDKIETTDGITNLEKVKLWGATGKAEYESDDNEKYIIHLIWTSEDADYYRLLLVKLKLIYGNAPTIDDSGLRLEWKIDSSSEYNNLGSVSLGRENNIITIIWETANNAYLIDTDIINFGEITLDSKQDLDNILESYNNLDDDYKEYVEQYDKLEEYYNKYYVLYAEYFDKTAEECNKSKSAENYDTAVKLLEEYESLDEKCKELITKYDIAKKAKSNSKEAKHNEIINDLDLDCISMGLVPYSVESRIKNNYDLLSNEEIAKYLPYAVCNDVLSYAESHLKSYLKNPSSYTRYDYKIRTNATSKDDNLYYVPVQIEYGATNSFNAMVRNEQTLYVYYRVNNNGITYVKTDFSAYDKWIISQ